MEKYNRKRNYYDFKNKISKNIRIFLNKFCECICALSGYILRLIVSFMISSCSTWERLREKPELQSSLLGIMIWWHLYFIIAFISGSPMLYLTGFISLYWGIPGFVIILEKNLFKTDPVFLSFCTMLPSSTTFFYNKGLSTPQRFYYYTRFSHWDYKKKNCVLPFHKSVTHKFLCLTLIIYFPQFCI